MQITSALGAGHIGSPVFDPRGRLVGLFVGTGAIEIGGENLRSRVGPGSLRFAMVRRAAGALRRRAPAGRCRRCLLLKSCTSGLRRRSFRSCPRNKKDPQSPGG